MKRGAAAKAPATYVLVASTGGHLNELVRLADRFEPAAEQNIWVSFDAPQTQSLLANENVVLIPHVVGRTNPLALFGLFRTAWQLLRTNRNADVISTGAAVAVPFILVARVLGRRGHYIETAARQDGPSLTGRILQLIPGTKLYTQDPAWASERWPFRGSILDGFEPAEPSQTNPVIQRVVVTFGMNPAPFDAVLGRLREVIPDDADVTWQLGGTAVPTDLPGAHRVIPAHEMRTLIRDADLVIAHAGMGSAVDALAAGHAPALVPRSFDRGEHLDDHQYQLADELDRRGLATRIDLEDLSWQRLTAAAGKRVSPSSQARFELNG